MAKKKSNRSTREKVLFAAKELFLGTGYRETSLDDVAASAGVTKPTVYSHFGSKQGLLVELVREHTAANAASITTVLQGSGDVESDLLRFGRQFLGRLMTKEESRWRRLAIAESVENPEIGEAIHAAGPATVLKAMAVFLRQETLQGRLSCDDPDLAAEQFMGMLIGMVPIRDMSGKPLPGKAKQQRMCEAAVKTFLAA
ncbi:MAG: TetR/AcrR family transcriptional regulator, partial [Planctomycetota bacterium]